MIDYSKDYLHWDNTEAVTVSTTLAGSTTTTSVSVALSADIKRSIFRGQITGLEGDELVWMIPIDLMGSVEINEGDKITQTGGAVWQVKQAFRRGIGTSDTHFECLCIRKRT